MQAVLLSSAYLAPIQYYSKLLHASEVYIECYCHYMKQSYRNRCLITGPNGPLTLTIPVEKDAPKVFTKDIRISDHGNWRHLHWNALEAAYNSTPFFEYYGDDFRPFYEKQYKYLFDFNDELCRMICRLIGFEPQLNYSTSYMQPDTYPYCDDLREKIHPKSGFETADQHYNLSPYYQVFQQKNGFISHLSIVDLLFNMGPESILVLRKSFR